MLAALARPADPHRLADRSPRAAITSRPRRSVRSDAPDIVADAAQVDAPKTAFGLIAAGLKRRRAAGVKPFTVMSCDNIPGNGHVTEHAVAGLAELSDPELAAWIRGNVAFPNSMVDRITPATSDRERAILRDSYGVEDSWPVFCEEFRQWVVEDKFPAGRPALEKVGVTFTSDVAPYELMKIRILNGGHAAIAYPAGLLDIHFVHEAMQDKQIAAFLETLTKREIMPVVPPPPKVDLDAYRARSPSASPIRRSATRSPALPRRLEPAAEIHPADGARPDRRRRRASRASRSSRRSGAATPTANRESGKTIPPNDPSWDRLQAAAKPARQDPRAFLALRDIFGDLASDPVYVDAFSGALTSLWAKGVRATLADYLGAKA